MRIGLIVVNGSGKTTLLAALLAANRKLCLNCAYKHLQDLNYLVRVGPVGLEPTTYGLKVRSSAN
jgi:hypothetical protein